MDRQHAHLVPPIVAEVEPIAEAFLEFETERTDGGFVHDAIGFIVCIETSDFIYIRTRAKRPIIPL